MPADLPVRYYGTQKGGPLERLWAIYAAVPAADDSGYWIGTPKGLYRSDANLSSLRHIETNIIRKNDVVFSMVESGGELWLGTQRGLIWYDPQNGN